MTRSSTRNPVRDFVLLVVLPLAVLALGTLAFRVWPLDLEFQTPFFHPPDGWISGESEPWRFLYRFGTLPALAVAIGALVLLAAGFRSTRLARHRKAAVFLILVMMLGPGLVVNGILKEGWGRPRPREVDQFGGRERFEAVLERDPASEGKSFPCGHATMGFYFCAFLYLFRREKRRLGWLLAAFGIVLGVLLGIARMAQGGHFASDILWAWGSVTLVAAGLFYLLRLHKSLHHTPNPDSWLARYPAWAVAGVGLVIAGLVFSALLATPYHDARVFRPDQPPPGEPAPESVEISILVEKAALSLAPGPGISARSEAHGFGLPGSAVQYGWRSAVESGGQSVRLKQRVSGLFAELQPGIVALFAPGVPGRIKVDLGMGDADIRLPETGAARKWTIHVGRGDVLLHVPVSHPPVRLKANIAAGTGKAINMVPTLTLKPNGLWESTSPPAEASASRLTLQRLQITVDRGDLHILPAPSLQQSTIPDKASQATNHSSAAPPGPPDPK